MVQQVFFAGIGGVGFYEPVCETYDLRWPLLLHYSLFTIHSTYALRGLHLSLYVFYLPLYETNDLRWLHLSLHGER